MNEELIESCKQVGVAYVKELATQLLSIGKRNTGDLINSLSYSVLKTLDGVVVNILSLDYLKEVDEGRKPGSKPPPSDKIAKWVRKKGIKFKGSTVEQTAFVIARSIGRKGIKRSDVINKTKQRVLENIGQILATAAEKDIETIINETFKDVV